MYCLAWFCRCIHRSPAASCTNIWRPDGPGEHRRRIVACISKYMGLWALEPGGSRLFNGGSFAISMGKRFRV